jgi:hypothetical protein
MRARDSANARHVASPQFPASKRCLLWVKAVADLEARPSLLIKLDYRDFDFKLSALVRLRLCDQDTKRLIVGARREVATSYALLAEVARMLALR